MKGPISRQRCALAEAPPQASDAKVKCVTMMVFEKSGKTIIQPLVTSQETQTIRELLQNETLEVWLPNGEADLAQFDVAILKYKQLMQLPTMCSISNDRVCLKNHFDTIVSCEQCPFTNDGAED
jgi:hypothetical protein